MSKPENLSELFVCELGDRFECVICGTLQEMAEKEYHLLGLCWKCGEIVANLYAYAHSLRYLTWPNRPTQPSGFVKRPIPEVLRWQVFERDEFACQRCGSRSMLRADHIFPESRGGPMTLENLQTLCMSCNSSKGNR